MLSILPASAVVFCISLTLSDIRHFFHVLIGHLCIFFGEKSGLLKFFATFEFLVVAKSQDPLVYCGY